MRPQLRQADRIARQRLRDAIGQRFGEELPALAAARFTRGEKELAAIEAGGEPFAIEKFVASEMRDPTRNLGQCEIARLGPVR